GLSRVELVLRSQNEPTRALASARERCLACCSRRGPALRHRQASDHAFVAAFVGHASAGRWLRYPNGSGTAWTFQRGNDEAVHARFGVGSLPGSQSVGPAADRPTASDRWHHFATDHRSRPNAATAYNAVTCQQESMPGPTTIACNTRNVWDHRSVKIITSSAAERRAMGDA